MGELQSLMGEVEGLTVEVQELMGGLQRLSGEVRRPKGGPAWLVRSAGSRRAPPPRAGEMGPQKAGSDRVSGSPLS